MAKKFGGDFSPEGQDTDIDFSAKNPYRGKRRTKVGGRVNILFFAPLPLAIRAFMSEPQTMALNLVAFGTLLLAAWLTRDGMIAQEAYDARRVARRVAIPRKIFGSALTGIGLFIAGYAGGSLMNAGIFAILGTVLHSFAFGLDPMKDKGMEGIDSFQTERVARAVGEAKKLLDAMSDAIKRAESRHLEKRVRQFQDIVHDMFRTLEDDPRDLSGARKYLSVYLRGARDATVKFADIYTRTQDPMAVADYLSLLDDLEENFEARTNKMLENDRSDLTVEIDVLRDLLKREGIRDHTEN